MADKVPIRAAYSGANALTGLATFASAETIGVAHGGTGVVTIGSNQLVTGNGTSAITSESNLTFDGTILKATGDLCATVKVVAPALCIGSEYVLPTADGSAGQLMCTDGSGALAFATAASSGADPTSTNTWTADQTFNDNVKVTLGTGGDADLSYNGADTILLTSVAGTGGLGIGIAPDLMIQDGVHIKTGDSGATANVHGDELIIEGSANSGINILSGASSVGRIAFRSSGGDSEEGAIAYVHGADEMVINANTTEAIRIDSSANVKLTTGNLVMSTSGKGIDFSATSDAGGMTSEVLDDYEEGTWTPEFRGRCGSAGSSNSTGTGTYTKIGNLVTIRVQAGWTDTGSWSGDVRVYGLPYTVGSSNSNYGNSLLVGYVTGITWTDQLVGYGQPSQDYLQVRYNSGSAGTQAAVDVSDVTTTAYLSFVSDYIV